MAWPPGLDLLNPFTPQDPTNPPTLCISPVSQQQADLCALRGAVTGNTQNPINGGTPPPLFFNRQQACPYLCQDGSFFISQVAAGLFTATSQAAADEQAAAYACQLATLNVYCTSGSVPNGKVGVAYSGSIQINGGFGPFSPALQSGTIPPGLSFSQSFDTRTLFLKGTPSAAGTFTFTMLIADGIGNVVQKSFTVVIAPGINWALLSWNLSSDNASGGASFTDLTAGATVNMSATGVALGSAVAQPVGSISYTGPSITASVQITLSVVNPNAFTFADFTVLYDPGGQNLILLSVTGPASGNFAFTIPNSPTGKTIQIITHAAAGLAGTFSSVLGTLS